MVVEEALVEVAKEIRQRWLKRCMIHLSDAYLKEGPSLGLSLNFLCDRAQRPTKRPHAKNIMREINKHYVYWDYYADISYTRPLLRNQDLRHRF